MTELSLPNVSVASSGGEYFQVTFEEKKDSEEMEDSEGAYFLIQRQFEAGLHREVFRLELVSRPASMVQIRFQADEKQYRRLKRVGPAELLLGLAS